MTAHAQPPYRPRNAVGVWVVHMQPVLVSHVTLTSSATRVCPLSRGVTVAVAFALSSPDTLPPSLFDVKARKERAKALAADDPAAGKRVMLTAVDTMLWQTMASVLVPGLTINRVCVVCVV